MASMKVKVPTILGKRNEQKNGLNLITIPDIDVDISETQRNVAVLRETEIVHGRLLGDGAFSQVFDLTGLKLRRFPMMKKERRKTRYALRDDLLDGEGQFAIKIMKASLKKGKERKIGRAIRGLMTEAKLLAKLSHENIVDIHGVSEDIANCDQDGNDKVCNIHDDYFIVLEKLDNTMDRVIWEWKFLGGEANHISTMIMVKINYALQIARALRYMHQRRIIYRDLKPQNIGLQGHTVKLFDFGLSRSLPERRSGPSSREDDEYYQMSFAGTPKYMAPEIFMTHKYNLKADVYSWSMVFYEMLTLIKPYEQYDRQLHVAYVCNLGERPDIGPHVGLPYAVDDLLVHAWDHMPENRPSMPHICEELEYMLQDTSFHATFAKRDSGGSDKSKSTNNSSSSYVSWNATAPTRTNYAPAAA